jgi:hypothetical protein
VAAASKDLQLLLLLLRYSLLRCTTLLVKCQVYLSGLPS